MTYFARLGFMSSQESAMLLYFTYSLQMLDLSDKETVDAIMNWCYN